MPDCPSTRHRAIDCPSDGPNQCRFAQIPNEQPTVDDFHARVASDLEHGKCAAIGHDPVRDVDLSCNYAAGPHSWPHYDIWVGVEFTEESAHRGNQVDPSRKGVEMPNPTHPPTPIELADRGGREYTIHHVTPSRSQTLPMMVVANPRATEGGENIRLRQTKRDDSVWLVIDRQRAYAQIEVTEPNVRELRDCLNRWLGE